jgi:membrane protein DedA with SNARE-associated domain
VQENNSSSLKRAYLPKWNWQRTEHASTATQQSHLEIVLNRARKHMDPLGSLIDWISVYGLVGLVALGLAERFLPALPSHGALVAIGIAANEGAWCLSVAIVATTAGSSVGALVLYYLVRAMGARLIRFLSIIRMHLRISPMQTIKMQSHFQARQRSSAFVSQMVPTVRLITPLIAGLHRVKFSSFAGGTILGVALWNSFFVLIGSFAARVTPEVNASALAIVLLACLIAAEAITVVFYRFFAGRDRGRRRENPIEDL